MLAILRVLENPYQLLSHKIVLIQSDNKSVVANLRHEGGTKSAPLLDITYKVFQILEDYQIHMNVLYIPGIYNAHADHLSRFRMTPEWQLSAKCTNKIFLK